MENIRRYNAHKLKLFGAVNNFKNVEEFWGQHVGESCTRVTSVKAWGPEILQANYSRSLRDWSLVSQHFKFFQITKKESFRVIFIEQI